MSSHVIGVYGVRERSRRTPRITAMLIPEKMSSIYNNRSEPPTKGKVRKQHYTYLFPNPQSFNNNNNNNNFFFFFFFLEIRHSI